MFDGFFFGSINFLGNVIYTCKWYSRVFIVTFIVVLVLLRGRKN